MLVEKSDKVLIEDLRRDAAIWFKDTSLNDLEELIKRYIEASDHNRYDQLWVESSAIARLEAENTGLRSDYAVAIKGGDHWYAENAKSQSELASLRATVGELQTARDELHAKLNTPEFIEFPKGVTLEAAHQRDRWGAENDAGKAPLDWFWLIGYLAQKAAMSAIAGDADKARHHTISTAAALANWHAALSDGDNKMRPGIDPFRAALAKSKGEG